MRLPDDPVHVAFTAPATAHVDRFAQAGTDAVGLTNREQTADRTEFSLDESERSFIVIAGEPTRNVRI